MKQIFKDNPLLIKLLCIGMIILSFACTGGGDTSTSSSGAVTLKEGDTAKIGYTTHLVHLSYWTDKLSDNQFMNAKANGKYLFVKITVRNDDKEARTIPPYKLIDENGAVYDTSSKAFGIKDGLGILESLNPSMQKAGWIVFDANPERTYSLKVSGGFWSTDEALIKLSPAQR